MSKKISKTCIDLVKKWEGCHLTAYTDEVGVWTIGYGITNADHSVTGLKVSKGVKITQAQADRMLEESLNKKYLPLVMMYDGKYDWNQNELDALVSFAYNIGSITALTAKGTRSRATIAEKMLLYNKAGGKVFKGLTKRRKEEHDLFLKPVKKTLPLPKLPDRGYFKFGDGKLTNKNMSAEIKKQEEILKFFGYDIDIDGKYLAQNRKFTRKFQKKHGLPVNGSWGEKCNSIARKDMH